MKVYAFFSVVTSKPRNIDPIDGLAPGFRSEADPFTDPEAVLLEWFMHQNGFKSYTQYDNAGWSPLCFAAMSGNAALVQSLLDKRASPNDSTQKPKKELVFGKNLSVLSIAAAYKSNQARPQNEGAFIIPYTILGVPFLILV